MGGCLLTRYDTARGPHTEILCKRMSCIVAQTMVRQLVTPREGVDLIGALSHIALRDFRSHWWSECVDASSRVNAKNVNVFSSSSARLLTASPIAFAVLGGSRWPTEPPLPASSVGSRCRPVPLAPRLVLAWEWRPAHCAAYATRQR